MEKQSSIQAIKAQLSSLAIEALEDFIRLYEADERKGVIQCCERAKKQRQAYEKEVARVRDMVDFDLKTVGGQRVCGVDEVGRGPLAGPVVTAVVMMPLDQAPLLYVNDSKKLSEKKREELYDLIMDQALEVHLGIRDVQAIDTHNILQATLMAMEEAVLAVETPCDGLIADAVTVPGIDLPQYKVIKGDEKSYNVAAASIVAKVTRDRMMVAYDELFPGYDWASNKGYGAKSHLEGLKRLGPTPIHRKTFIKNLI